MATKKQNKRAKVRRGRRVLNRTTAAAPTTMRTARFGYGRGLSRNMLSKVEE